jgi:hypothetical protein
VFVRTPSPVKIENSARSECCQHVGRLASHKCLDWFIHLTNSPGDPVFFLNAHRQRTNVP